MGYSQQKVLTGTGHRTEALSLNVIPQISISWHSALARLLNATSSGNVILAVSCEQHMFDVMQIQPAAITSRSQAGR